MQTVSGMRISCYNSLCSNARRQLASALLYQVRQWRWVPEGKCSTLRAPYSLYSSAPLILIKCLLNPSNLFSYCSPRSDVLQGLWQHNHFWWTSGISNNILQKEITQSTEQKRKKRRRTRGHTDHRPQDMEPLFFMLMNKKEKLQS